MIASFGTKTFEASSSKIMTPSEMSMSEKLDYETQERAGDKPAIYVKGLGALEIKLTVELYAQYVDVQQEIVFWLVKMRTAEPDLLTLGNRAWGMGRSLLTSVDISELRILGNGEYGYAKVDLSFTEFLYAGKDDDGNPATTGPGIKASRIQLEELGVKK